MRSLIATTALCIRRTATRHRAVLLIMVGVLLGALRTPLAHSANIWTEGFSDVNSWTAINTKFVYNALNYAQGGGSAYAASTGTTYYMYRSANPTNSRPFYTCTVRGFSRTTSNGYHATNCNVLFRNMLHLTATGASSWLSVGYNSSVSNTEFFSRQVADATQYVSMGQRGTNGVTCTSAQWIEFKITVNDTTVDYWTSNGAETARSHSRTRPSASQSDGITQVRLGQSVSINGVTYWDAIFLDANAPATPTGMAGSANSTTQITWSATAVGSVYFGFEVFDSANSSKYVSSDTSRTTNFSWAEGSLSANTSYSRYIKAWNGNQNSAATSTVAKYTLIQTPATPTFGTVTDDSIVLNTSGVSNIAAGSSGAYFDSTTAGGDGGINAWVQATTDTATGLTANSSYTFQVKARNGDAVETVNSGTASKRTLIQTPTGVNFGTVTANSIVATPAGTLTNLAQGSSGVRTSNTTASNNSGWEQDTSGYTSSGLTPNTQYSFVARARNGDSIETGDSASSNKYTLAGTASVGNNIACDRNVGTGYASGTLFTFSNPATFGTSTHGGGIYKVSKYKYVWDKNATYTFTGSETDWSSGTVATTDNLGMGTYYLHLQSFNGDNVATTGTYNYGPFNIGPTPAITAYHSTVFHDSGIGEMALALDADGPATIEPRRSDSTKIRVTFDMVVEPIGTLGNSHVSVKDSGNTPQNPTSVTFVGGGGTGTMLLITFTPALADVDCYTVLIPDNKFRSQAAGIPMVANQSNDTDCEFCILVGDVAGGVNGGDRLVNGSDLSMIKLANRGAVGAGNFRLDINSDGKINLIDAALCKSKYGGLD